MFPGRAGQNGFIAQIAPDIGGEVLHGVVAAVAVFIEAFHDHAIEVSTNGVNQLRGGNVAAAGNRGRFFHSHRAEAGGRPGRFSLADNPAHFVQSGADEILLLEGRFAGDQLVEKHAQAIDVASQVDFQAAHFGLFGAHVGGGTEELLERGEKGLIGQASLGGFGDSEIDDLGDRDAVMKCHEDIGRFNVPVNNSLLMRVLNGAANLQKQIKAFFGRQAILVAELGDLDASNQFHHEVGSSGRRRARIQNFGNVRVVHQRESLPLRREAGDHLFGVHAKLDQLESDPPTDGFLLFGHVNDSAAAFANLLEQLVPAYLIGLGFGRLIDPQGFRRFQSREKSSRRLVCI